jgi:hypothetical protein
MLIHIQSIYITALKAVEETLPGYFVRRDVDHTEAEKCNDGKCFVDL